MNTKIARVTDHPDLVRDLESKAILAVDQSKYKEYKQKKDLLKNTMRYGEEIENLKRDVSEIKSLLIQMINNINKS